MKFHVKKGEKGAGMISTFPVSVQSAKLIPNKEKHALKSLVDYIRGRVIIPCNHLFSLHMVAFIQSWQYLHQV